MKLENSVNFGIIFCFLQKNVKVAVLGAAGGIGQPLALLLKHSPMISHLALYDLAPFTPGRKGFLCGHSKYSPIFRIKHVFLCKKFSGQGNEQMNICDHCFLKNKVANLMFLTNHSLIFG